MAVVPAVTDPGSLVRVGARAEPAQPEVAVAAGFSARPVPLGLDRPLHLLGGNALKRLGPDLGLPAEWFPSLVRAVADEGRRRLESGERWFGLPPTLLVGDPGTGRGHAARRVAEAAGVPLVPMDLSEPDSVLQLRGERRGPELVLPSLPVLAMATTRCANPLVLVTGIDRASPHVQALLARMLAAGEAARWREDALGAVVDLGHVTWLVSVEQPGTLDPTLRACLQRVHLPPPGPVGLRFRALEILIEVVGDLGLSDPAADPAVAELLVDFAEGRSDMPAAQLRARILETLVRPLSTTPPGADGSLYHRLHRRTGG
ncbi:hypothetical protein CA236_11360 [Sphingomonas sp. ABOLG]|jgi:hypothetical protein|uniref:hypothetical protein n=1 Tax=Sphingomonas sp. ABOLG TaxID=1985880 RepID=UPI000F7E8E92|nr:hypothetical protein [Sphingomonas sp. ABOLG]RSV17320.1 hypothetical protein CA236_11360 [Sphingomonas sp. ABOLG]